MSSKQGEREVARPSCKDCRVGRGYRPFLDYVELCSRHASVEALYLVTQSIVEFCDDPDGSNQPESLAMGLSRLLQAARTALAAATKGTDHGK